MVLAGVIRGFRSVDAQVMRGVVCASTDSGVSLHLMALAQLSAGPHLYRMGQYLLTVAGEAAPESMLYRSDSEVVDAIWRSAEARACLSLVHSIWSLAPVMSNVPRVISAR